MQKKLFPILTSVVLMTALFSGASALDPRVTNQIQKNDPFNIDPFDNDPFFQSSNDALRQMYKMQQAMDQFMKQQFAQMQNSLVNQPNPNLFGSTSTIEIKEGKKGIIYKIKLPKGADSKVDVAVKNGQLVVSTNITQKITREEDHNKSVSYSQSNYSQSFQLPKGYDPNSMATKMKDSNLIVTFKKKYEASSIL